MKHRLLIIEDDRDILRVLKDQFETDGFEVDTAENAAEALKKLNKNPVDLIILDINLPDMDGFTLCKKIRESKDTPIIMLTVKSDVKDKITGFESGADDYVTKPFDYMELLARVKARLRRTQKPRILDFGYLRIDASKMEVTVNSRPVSLTKREFELLYLLASHSGEVLSRDFIKSRIWKDKELYPWSRTIDVHIKKLRSKIEPDPENPSIILTCPGIGYKFVPPNKNLTEN